MNKLHLFLAGTAALAGCQKDGASNNGSDGGGSDGLSTGMYVRRVDLPVGAYPQSMAVSDFNHDGKPDVLLARATTSGALTAISVDSSGTPTATLLNGSIGDTPYGLGVGDFDGDGLLDVTVANYLGGDATALFGSDFLTKVSFGDGSHPNALAVGDVNSDGKLDVLLSNQVNKSVGIILNMGSRMFATRVDYSTGTAPSALLLGATDSTRPSRLDIVATLPTENKVRILTGQGGGTYSAAQFVDLAVGTAPVGLAMADLNSDSSPDLIVANRVDNTVSVLMGQGSGAFAQAVPYTVGNSPLGVATGDIDGDGRIDVVVTNNGGGSISILRGQAGGTLKLTDDVAVGAQPQPVVIADIDKDGVQDIIVGNYGAGTVTVLFGKKL
jgi:hypothetical protein